MTSVSTQDPSPHMPDREIGEHAFRLCQTLLRIDTTNPPGRERAAAEVVAGELAAAGLDPITLESAPERTNVVARLRGTGELPPILLTAHLDVVEAEASAWKHPPFSGVVADGCLWGRGAIDMKNMAAMSVAILARLAREKPRLRRDVIFAAVADEEAGCDHGSRFLVENHADLVRAEYAIGESGGYTLHLGKATFYPIQVAEKGICWVRARVRGEPGHGSMPREDSAVVKLANAIARLGEKPLPVHVTPYIRDFVDGLASKQPAPLRSLLRRLLHPAIAPHVLRALPDRSMARSFGAMLSNTASPTILRAGAKVNVIPGFAEAEIDGRTLPGQTEADFLRELGAVLGPEVSLEVIRSAPATAIDSVDSPLFDAMRAAILDREPGATVVPYMIPGFTDAQYFTRLGAKWYGFSPVKMPKGLRFAELFHGHDERIPVDGLKWGTEVLFDVVRRFCQ
ncbi:M20/M25/M40 family metallo-hydrolase [Polyangium jinanense]|uniref:M20/M25/M40 family metallo-hydrolase n=1 Tax=Polyangium jinanense TaxID=2829994 RepID=A0A9X3X4Q5_9BACT|nr:M20/M25/M40 family metallo-hydrolase [Polyangium jinanense]MDC3957318.1 M20/M25/M40 family metallo-hydrolase [Polyangium jinanense]MDC3982720.1 M20/M25/M40 family metallo-hydrolase [Polyangium jinanense]